MPVIHAKSCKVEWRNAIRLCPTLSTAVDIERCRTGRATVKKITYQRHHDAQRGVNLRIRLVVAEDQPIVREGFKWLVQLHDDLELVGEATNGQEALEQVRRLRPDVVVLDIGSSNPRFLEILGQLRNEKAKVLVLSLYPERLYAVRAFRNGAAGSFNKEHSADELVEAIRHIHSTGKHVTSDQAEMLAHAVDDDGNVPHRGLSDREYEVFQLLASGHTVSAIGESLSLSPKTVSTYRTRLLRKLHGDSNADLVRYACEHGLLG